MMLQESWEKMMLAEKEDGWLLQLALQKTFGMDLSLFARLEAMSNWPGTREQVCNHNRCFSLQLI